MGLPILYSYRRCPYAMRARMALHYAGIDVEIREISFKSKPQHMLQASPKGTVPVLVLADGEVIDESLDVMRWALSVQNNENWLLQGEPAEHMAAMALIAENDGAFKQALDRYKYPERFPQQPQVFYRAQGELFLQKLEQKLSKTGYLFGNARSLADVAIFPFVRQFVAVDDGWFASVAYPKLRIWLANLVESELFLSVMQKHPVWIESK